MILHVKAVELFEECLKGNQWELVLNQRRHENELCLKRKRVSGYEFIEIGFYIADYENRLKSISIDMSNSLFEVENILSPIINKYESYDITKVVTLRNQERIDKDIHFTAETLNKENMQEIVAFFNQAMQEQIIPYFEQYQSVQDINDKVFPILKRNPKGRPYFNHAFAGYGHEKALIVLKLCDNPYYQEYYNWYKNMLPIAIEKKGEEWELRAKIFKDLDEQFLSKEI